jgi:uncharacterized membrane protein YwaF
MIRAILFFLVVMTVSISIVFVVPAISRKEADRKLILKVILTLALAAALFAIAIYFFQLGNNAPGTLK